MSPKVRVLDSAPSRRSSGLRLDGLRPPPAVKSKFCGSFGFEFSTTTTLPRLRLLKVQVTVSPGETSMFESALPSSQEEPVRSQLLGAVSSSEYPLPGTRFEK